MMDRLAALTEGFTFSGDPKQDIPAFLQHHDCPKTAVHVVDVAVEALRLARRFGANPAQAELAGYLHDVSAVIPNGERIAAAQAWGIDVLPEEAAFPMLIHQKLSAYMGRAIFDISDEAVLSAAGHHTTLYAGATLLDTVVFVADKIAWDQPGAPPYLTAITGALDESINAAALVYLRHLWERRETLRVLHPWARAAYFALADEM